MTTLNCCVFLLAVCLSPLAWCYPRFQTYIPNGGRVINPCSSDETSIWGGVGHTNKRGGGPLNQFGKDFMAEGYQWTEALCHMDSDGDGRSNGEELGDPDCVWQPASDKELAEQSDGPDQEDAKLREKTRQMMMDDLEERRKRDIEAQISHPGVCQPLDSATCIDNNAKLDGCDASAGSADVPPDDGLISGCPALSDALHRVQPDGQEAVKTTELRFPKTRVPSADTSYYCRTFQAPEQEAHNIIAFQNIFDNQNVIHHMIVFGCRIQSYPPGQLDRLKPCGLVNEFCTDMIYAWKIGVDDRCLDARSGVPFGAGGYNTFVLQIHWNNPEMRSDYFDASGVRLYYTSELRPHFEQVALFMQGTIDVPPSTANYTVSASCPGPCIQETLYITTMFLHMHKLGQSGQVELFRGGSLLQTLVIEEDYNDVKPKFYTFNPPVQIQRGDEVKVTCQYNSLDSIKHRVHAVHGGYRASEEMCIAFTTYYPNQDQAFACIQYGNELSPCDDPREHTQYSVFPADDIDISEQQEHNQHQHEAGDHQEHNHDQNPGGMPQREHTQGTLSDRSGDVINGGEVRSFHLSDRQRQLLILELFSQHDDKK